MKSSTVAGLLAVACAAAGCKKTGRPADGPGGTAPAPAPPRRAASLVAGARHTCVLFSDGAVRCWGVGADGRLGTGSISNVGDTTTPHDGQDVRLGGKVSALAAGAGHSCALMATGAVRCWGDGAFGQLGYGGRNDVGDDEDPSSAGDLALGEAATALAAGDKHTCALLISGAVRCWGGNEFEQLGAPIRPAGGGTPASFLTFDRRVIALAAYRASTCVGLEGGSVRCWGRVDGGWGNEMLDVELGAPAASLATGPGYGRGCAITTTGAARCWGTALGADLADFGFPGERRVAPLPDTGHPTVAQVGDLAVSGSITHLGLSEHNACAITAEGALWCWGDRSDVADDSWVLDDTVATDVPLGARAVDLAMGAHHVCVLLDTGGVRCWGRGADGVLGRGKVDDVGPPRGMVPTSDVPM